MKYKVLKTFKDKETKKIYHESKLYISENLKRVKELQKLGFISQDEIEKVEKKSDQKKRKKETAVE